MSVREEQSRRSWQRVHPKVHRFMDSCNVYAIDGTDGSLIVDAGGGLWIDHLADLPLPPVALICTHFFRDHSAGARRASELGLPVYVPGAEHPIFADPRLHFLGRETYDVYSHYWDHYAPIEGVPDAVPLPDYAELQIAGLSIRVVPLPGVTVGQIGIEVATGEANCLVFCGEAIHSHGRLARVAPLQYGLTDLDGVAGAWGSARRLRSIQPDCLFPSLGSPICSGVDDALVELQSNLRGLAKNSQLGKFQSIILDDVIAKSGDDDLTKVSDRVWLSKNGHAISTFVLSGSGRVLAIDYGYDALTGLMHDGYFAARPGRRRAVLHSLDALERLTGVRGVSCVLVTHYHDDHVAGIPDLQRLFGTECWASDVFAEALERPETLALTAVCPRPVDVTRRIPCGAQVHFDDLVIDVGPQTGAHTRLGALIAFDCDGLRYAHTGDELYFWVGAVSDDMPVDWSTERLMRNEMFRSMVSLDGYEKSIKWLLEQRPDIIFSGHHAPIHTNASFFQKIDEVAEHAMDMYERVTVLGSDEPNFGVDGIGGIVLPYRTHLQRPEAFQVRVVARNPLPYAAQLRLSAAVPSGWLAGPPASRLAQPRGEVECSLEITPSETGRRMPFAVELTAEEVPFGQVAEGLVTVGGQAF